MLIGYMRVSKADGSQVLDLQRDALLAAGITAERLYEDLASGRRDDRPGLAACIKALRKGDTLVASKLDRLGRDLHHLVNPVHDRHLPYSPEFRRQMVELVRSGRTPEELSRATTPNLTGSPMAA